MVQEAFYANNKMENTLGRLVGTIRSKIGSNDVSSQ